VSRYGRADTSFALDRRDHSQPVDLALGTRRARAAALLTMALPGSVYLYQGEELGLWEVEDLPAARRQDPIWHRTNGADPGRDGSRVPLPWSGAEPPFGFSPPAARKEPWLPQPQAWHALTVESESADSSSILTLYRRALHLRRKQFARDTLTAPSPDTPTAPSPDTPRMSSPDIPATSSPDTPMTWLPGPSGVLAFTRGPLACITNLSPSPVPLPEGDILLISAPHTLSSTSSHLPPDTTAWIHLPAAP
jgi:alpha-glucosidase